jgi:hypothetical protein
MTMAEPTKAELLEENAALRARVGELESGAAPAQARPSPQPPSFGISEGTRNDIEQAKHRIATDPTVNEVQVADPNVGAVMTVTADSGDTFVPDEQSDRELTQLNPHPDRITAPVEQQ